MEGEGITVRARMLIVFVVVAALIGAGVRGFLVAAPASTPRCEPSATTTREARSLRSGPGAVAAAVRFVRAGQRLYDLAPETRDDALRAMASPDAADGWLRDQHRTIAELDAIAARGEGPLIWDVAVLATRLDALTRTRARVQVWRLGILSIGGLTAPVAEYTTVTYELVWIPDRGWRIWSETQRPGPSPMPHPEAIPSTPADLDAALDGFVRYPGAQPVTR